MKKCTVFLLVIVLALSCACTERISTSNTESNVDSSAPECVIPWQYIEFYTNDFVYPTIDEFCEKVSKNGTDELFDCVREGRKPKDYDDKRRENITNLINNCVYEVYYKGEKADFQEIIGFKIHLGGERIYSRGEDSYCEYFVKIPGNSDWDYIAHLRFYEMSRIKEEWDEFVQGQANGNSVLSIATWPYRYDMAHTLIKIPYNDTNVDCVMNGIYDYENDEWIHWLGGAWLGLRYSEDVLIFIDFVPTEIIDLYAERSPIEKRFKIKKELAVNDTPEFEKTFFDDFFENFTFEKVSVDLTG